MTFVVEYTNGFKRDYKRILKRHYEEAKLYRIVEMLSAAEPLPARCHPHKFVGEYTGCWECHIAPDWLLIYLYDDRCVRLIRTGTHADLFE